MEGLAVLQYGQLGDPVQHRKYDHGGGARPFWIGTAAPAEVGGVLAEFDGETWKQYTSRDTGFSGAEALVIIVDRDRRRWIGTRTTGIDYPRAKSLRAGTLHTA